MNDDTLQLRESLASCNEDGVMKTIEHLLESGMAAEEIVDTCHGGMCLLGERFDQGEAFIPDLMFGGLIMKKAMARLSPLLKTDETDRKGKTLVIGTVQYDVHDIGKDITAMVFRSNGFNVIDLGVDVPPDRFVEAIREHRPDFVGMSVLLTTCYKSVSETMDAIRLAGLRESVKTCVGGAAASELVARSSGIDFYGKTPTESVTWAKQFE